MDIHSGSACSSSLSTGKGYLGSISCIIPWTIHKLLLEYSSITWIFIIPGDEATNHIKRR